MSPGLAIKFLHTIAEEKCSEQFGYFIDSVDTSFFSREINLKLPIHSVYYYLKYAHRTNSFSAVLSTNGCDPFKRQMSFRLQNMA